ncbi:Riboflavin transporter MCH5 [Diaporthe amygdali]|uniref:Riboflavin transporter MCH5 n=1 Tax=Phomopsis amygdali TaxID=1214568 RepID=UPI0022FE9833|nr:Riboflavin transporter MCH5 [Diaporthe amygdali]KAJ0104053.1 Riboflavin transporter MCH5 [Diaporthe amygdali]
MTKPIIEAKPSTRSFLVVAGAALSLFSSVGFLNSFGVFEVYYKANMLQNKSESDISWLGSVSIFMLYILAPLAGVLVDRIGPKVLLCSGSLGLLVAVFMTSLCTEYFQFFLSQALLLGLSMSFVTWPPVAVVSRHLPHHRGLALGLVISGSSLGGLVWPIVLQRLLYHTELGFNWTMRIVGFIMMPLLAAACLTIVEAPHDKSQPSIPDHHEQGQAQEHEENIRSRKQTDLSIIKQPAFIFLCSGLAIGYLGLFAPFFYVSSYAVVKGVSPSMSFYLISILNAASLFGRVFPGILADRWGHFNFMVVALATSAIVGFCWTAATSLAGLIVWSLTYGFTSGAVMSLQGACSGKLASRDTQGTTIGLVTGSISVTVLVGTPIAGQLVATGGYLALSMFTGASLGVGSMIVALARIQLDRQLLSAV